MKNTSNFSYKPQKSWNWKLLIFVIVFSIIVSAGSRIFVRAYIFQSFKVPSSSMKPTLLVGDNIFVNKLSLDPNKFERGDIIVFEYPKDPSKVMVKRVIGLPGDIIEIRDKALFVNDNFFEEDYVVHADQHIFTKDLNERNNFGPITIPANYIFVLGDNRDASFDSRFWGFVEVSKVEGKVNRIYWSWDEENSRVRWERIGDTVH
jgi:signal peptidase I